MIDDESLTCNQLCARAEKILLYKPVDVPVSVVTSNLNAQLLQLSDEVAAVKTLISKKMCCFKCGKEGNHARNCGSGRKSAIVCYKCGKRGHFSATCSKN